MDKKNLKWYESPVSEIIEMETEGQLLAGSSNTNADNVDEDPLG